MHILFLDESGQLSERKFFALGGIALAYRDWHPLRDLWHETLSSAGWPTEREVKWRDPHRRGSASARRRRGRRSGAGSDQLLRDAPRHRARVARRPGFLPHGRGTYATGLVFLAERFQLLLENTDDVGMIVVDSGFRDDDARLRRFLADLTKDGSP